MRKELRQPKTEAYMTVLLQPLQSLNTLFIALAASIRYKMSINGQVVYLEHYLNDSFDPILRRIYIDDPLGQNITPIIIFNKVEQQATQLIYNKSENVPNAAAVHNKIQIASVDFVVYIPTMISSIAISVQINSLVNHYRIAGKRFAIITF